MVERGLLIRHDRGLRVAMQINADVTHFDATNAESRKFIWSKVKKNYYDLGIKVFWLDEAEPEFTIYDYDIIRYHAGTDLPIGNIYPKEYARAFYEGMEAEGQTNIVNLLRCAWAGSAKYGALVYPGGTTDIGGFRGGDIRDPKFHELFVRWFQWGAFCPVMRLHGDREPKTGKDSATGADNEIWSYGDEVYEICKKYINIRETLRDYTRDLMKEAHEKGSPLIRPMFYEFPKDDKAWTTETQYMYGSKYLVAPVLSPKEAKRTVYLPADTSWKSWDGGESRKGGQTVEVACSIDTMPVFVRE